MNGAAPLQKNHKKNPSDPRESMRCLGRFFQPILTEITGKPLHDEVPSIRWTPGRRLGLHFSVLAAGVLGGIAIVHGPVALWPLMPIAWILTAGAARAGQTTFVHHASHGNLFDRQWLGRFVGESLSLLYFVQPLSLYTREHKLHHADLASSRDADLRFLVTLGVEPGLSVEAYRRWLRMTLISPRFHWRFLKARAWENLIEAPPLRRLLSVLYLSLLFGCAAWSGVWRDLILVWLVPLLPVFHIAGLMQLLTEHTWVRHGENLSGSTLDGITNARFMGEQAPPAGLVGVRRLQAWALWCVRMICIHGTARILIVTGDLPAHDYHHRMPRGKAWAAVAYARRDNPRAARGRELWGLSAALDATFAELAALPASAKLGEPVTYVVQIQGLSK